MQTENPSHTPRFEESALSPCTTRSTVPGGHRLCPPGCKSPPLLQPGFVRCLSSDRRPTILAHRHPPYPISQYSCHGAGTAPRTTCPPRHPKRRRNPSCRSRRIPALVRMTLHSTGSDIVHTCLARTKSTSQIHDGCRSPEPRRDPA